MPITFETLYDKMTLIREGKRQEITFEIRTGPFDRYDRTRLQPPLSAFPKIPNIEEPSSVRRGYSVALSARRTIPKLHPSIP